MYSTQNLGQFLFRLAVYYLAHGYYFYVLQELPEGGDYEEIDRRIATKYQVTGSRMARLRVRASGESAIRYLRWRRYALILACEGDRKHRFFLTEQWQDIRVNPLVVSRYSVGVAGGKPTVRLRAERFEVVAQQMERIALHRLAKVQSYFDRITPFGFKGLQEQKRQIARLVNKRRRRAGLPSIEVSRQRQSLTGKGFQSLNNIDN